MTVAGEEQEVGCGDEIGHAALHPHPSPRSGGRFRQLQIGRNQEVVCPALNSG